MAIDASAVVAPTARVHPDASIGAGARIGEYCVIESDVSIGAGCVLEPYVFVKRWTTLGERNEISACTALGTDPFDKNFTGERSYLRIGNGNKIREHFTVSRGTAPESATEIGDGNYIMSVRAHRAQLQDRRRQRDRELRAAGGIRGGGGPGVYFGRRGHPPVLQDRAPGHDRGPYRREQRRAAVHHLRRIPRRRDRAEPGGPEARGLRRGADRGGEEGVRRFCTAPGCRWKRRWRGSRRRSTRPKRGTSRSSSGARSAASAASGAG